MKKITIDTSRCKGCDLCVAACPKKILKLSETALNKRGVHPVELTDEAACISCAFCAMMCPDSVITVEKEEKRA